MMANIGFIGLGHMGHPMVLNLLKHQHQVKVYDVVAKTIQSLVREGAIAAQSPVEAAQNVDIVITMLQTGEQVSDVCLGNNGIFAHIKPDALYIDSSSIAINTTLNLHAKAKEMGLAMVDAPVSGGVKGAEVASLTIMVGGEEDNFLRAKPILKLLGKCVIHAGLGGKGQVAKICNNMILGVSMIAVSEAFSLGEKLGLDPRKLFEISSNASGQCWSMTSYCPVPGIIDNVPSNNDYQPGFTSAMMLKDLRLSQDAAQFAKMPTKMGALATEIYDSFVNSSYADLDFSGIIKLFSKDTDQTVK